MSMETSKAIDFQTTLLLGITKLNDIRSMLYMILHLQDPALSV